MIGEISPRTISCRFPKADLFLPQRRALRSTKREEPFSAGSAVNGHLAGGVHAFHLPAFSAGESSRLAPLWVHAGGALSGSTFYAAAIHTDENDLWNPKHYNTHALKRCPWCGFAKQSSGSLCADVPLLHSAKFVLPSLGSGPGFARL